MPPNNNNQAAAARQKTAVDVTKKLPAPPVPPPLVNASLVYVAVDAESRCIELRFLVASDDGSRKAPRHITIRDGVSSVATPDGPSQVETADGFETASASLKTFLAAMLAHAESLSLI